VKAQENIPMLDLKQQYLPLREQVLEAFTRLFDSGAFILGKEVETLETQLAKYLETKYAIGVTSGTDAIWLALKALGIGPGDKVLTSPFTFFATVSAICNTGAEPVFADIDSKTFNLDPEKAEEVLKKEGRVKAIMPVHVYGLPAEMSAFKKLSEKYGAPLIEDAAQAIGSTYHGKKVGGLGALGCFSFYPTKNLAAVGDAGLLVTQDEKLADTARLIRTHGSRVTYYHERLGSNLRIDAIQAAALNVFLPSLDGWIEKRRQNAEVYNRRLEELPNLYDIPKTPSTSRHSFHQYTIRVKNGRRDALHKHLKDRGVSSMIYYPVPCHLQTALKHLDYQKGMFPESERAAAEVLSLPVFPTMTTQQQDYVLANLLSF
jgi:dTDP-4-amino-4,6-dideoxygalactose transaminase